MTREDLVVKAGVHCSSYGHESQEQKQQPKKQQQHQQQEQQQQHQQQQQTATLASTAWSASKELAAAKMTGTAELQAI